MTIPVDGAELEGRLQVPAGARGMVLFAHGSGSSRRSPRNLSVAQAFHARGLGTLLFDLLTPAEASHRRNVFDVELLGSRLLEASDWTRRQGEVGQLPRGYFGASTGAAAALWAAGSTGKHRPRRCVARGPTRPRQRSAPISCDAQPCSSWVERTATFSSSTGWRPPISVASAELAVVPGATHLFEEPGALDEVARLSGGWFERYLPDTTTPGSD